MDTIQGTTAYEKVIDTDENRHRLDELFRIAKSFYPEELEDVFVSEYRQADGRQVIESVWFFTPSYIAEFKDPLTSDRFDLAVLDRNVVYMEASRKSFDFEAWQDESRFTVDISLASGITATLKATGVNCMELLRLVRKRVFPNVVVPGAGVKSAIR